MQRLAFLLILFAGVGLAVSPGKRPEESLGGTSIQAGRLAFDSIRAARQRVRATISGSSTYIGHTLRVADSMLRRWPERVERPIRVHIPESAIIPGYQPLFLRSVEEAFRRWEELEGLHVRFAFVSDSSDAEVMVRWRERFRRQRTGQTDVEWYPQGWLRSGTLLLATRTRRGYGLSPDAVYAVALHEIGHLLGLGHSDHPDDVMYPSTAAYDLTARDRATVSLLYSLPPGSLRDPGHPPAQRP